MTRAISGSARGSAARRSWRASGDERASLLAAGVLEAEAVLAIADNDHENLQFALTARDLNPNVRIVLRQFNRALGRKIEQNLTDCSVVSLSSHSAATYASAAVDPACFFGLQFPDIDGPLVGFFERSGSEAELARSTPADIGAAPAAARRRARRQLDVLARSSGRRRRNARALRSGAASLRDGRQGSSAAAHAAFLLRRSVTRCCISTRWSAGSW